MPSQDHLNFINKLNDAKIPRQSQLIANRLFMKNFPREVQISVRLFFSPHPHPRFLDNWSRD